MNLKRAIIDDSRRGHALKALLLLAISLLVTACAADPSSGLAQEESKRYADFATFSDCEGCPVMVAIPPGRFRIGDSADPSGKGQEFQIRYKFAVGKFEVTIEQWDACVSDGGCRFQADDEGWGRGRRPVNKVSWDDATEYATWLSRKTGKPYRLLNEAEWEYVARAGAETNYAWGQTVGHGNANCRGCKGGFWGTSHTLPVGTFAANRFGLHDVHGNVWELVDDCWHHNTQPPAANLPRSRSGDCRYRVIRGGSWYSKPEQLSFSTRLKTFVARKKEAKYDAGWNDDVGFRVARIIE